MKPHPENPENHFAITHPHLDNTFFSPTIDSTNAEAHRQRRKHANRNILFIADEQTDGKGQHGRSWYSQKGAGLWFSLLLGRPEHLRLNLHLLSLYTGIIGYEVIDYYTSKSPDLKWPNDILLNSKKIAGILTEVSWRGNVASSAVVGIGINMFQSENDFPDNLKDQATSLVMWTVRAIDRVSVLQKFITEFFDKYSWLASPDTVISQWESRSSLMGRDILFQDGTKRVFGTFSGLDTSGHARIRCEAGEYCYPAGNIRLISDKESEF